MPRQQKKRKVSDLTTSDSEAIVNALDGFIENLDPNDEDTATVIDQVQALKAKLTQGSHKAFSSATSMDLQQLGFRHVGLEFTPNSMDRARKRGRSETADEKRLSFEATKLLVERARRHVSQVTEAGCRIIIDLVMLRLASMLSDSTTNINIIAEYSVLATKLDSKWSYGGVVDYLVTKHPSKYSNQILTQPVTMLARSDLTNVGSTIIFEAKTIATMPASLPQAIIAMAAWCRLNRKTVSRGVITCGDQWLFVAYKDEGLQFGVSSTITMGMNEENLDLILGMLVDWIENAHEFDEQEYFELV